MLRTLIVVMAVMAAGLATVPASADQGKGKDKGKSEDKGKSKDKGHETGHETVVVFNDDDRHAVHTYWVETYGRGNCPPGLAKKHNGCLPPGQAKKRYVIGQPLPPTIVIHPLPPVLVTRLGPVPAGYEYGVVDGDVLKLAVGTKLVVDAIQAILN
jgi:hypothetical protein